MGPPGLWAELRRQGAATLLSGPDVELLLEGKTVAVDAAVWLYEAQSQQELVQAYGPERAALKVIFERCVRWLRKGVLPVIVLEGSGGGRAQRSFSRGYGALGSAFCAQTRIRHMLRSLGIPFVDAEGEAEAACAMLAANGQCDFVATTDFDAILFGSPKVLKGLDLAMNGSSKCEVWEMSRIESVVGLNRQALVCAAFLIGCDYDCRSLSQCTDRDATGVRGIGPRKAVQILQALRANGGGDSVKAMEDLLCGKYHEAPKKNATKQQRLLKRTMSLAVVEPECMEGFSSVMHQYMRLVGTQSNGNFSKCGPFVWNGIRNTDARATLEFVFGDRTPDKLEPLQLEWSLRAFAYECPAEERASIVKRRKWAASIGLQYIPLRAKPPCRHAVRRTPYVRVDFDSPAGKLLQLSSDRKQVRMNLAKACGLLDDASYTRKDKKRKSLGKQLTLHKFARRCSRASRSSCASDDLPNLGSSSSKEKSLVEAPQLKPDSVVPGTPPRRALRRHASTMKLPENPSDDYKAATAKQVSSTPAGLASNISHKEASDPRQVESKIVKKRKIREGGLHRHASTDTMATPMKQSRLSRFARRLSHGSQASSVNCNAGDDCDAFRSSCASSSLFNVCTGAVNAGVEMIGRRANVAEPATPPRRRALCRQVSIFSPPRSQREEISKLAPSSPGGFCRSGLDDETSSTTGRPDTDSEPDVSASKTNKRVRLDLAGEPCIVDLLSD